MLPVKSPAMLAPVMPFRFARTVARAAATAALFVSLAAAPAPNVLRYADGIEPSTLVPYGATLAGEYRLAELSMAFLVRYGGAGSLRADLAREVPTRANGGISADGRTITYRLRPNLRWSDGEPLTSADLAFTVEFVRSNIVDTYPIFKAIRRVETPDPQTAVVHLAQAEPDAVVTLFNSRAGTCVLPKHLTARLGNLRTSAFAAAPVGAGPYRVTAFRRGDRVVLEANPFYAGTPPNIAQIEYRFIPDTNTRLVQMRSGELDLALNVPIALARTIATDRRLTLLTVLADRLTALDLNASSPVLSDAAVRRALRMAIDRRGMFQRVIHGEGALQESLDVAADDAYSPLPERPYDPREAERLLDAAGFRRGPDGIRARRGTPLRLRYAYVSSPATTAVTELVRADFARIGVALDAKAYAVGQLFAPAGDGGILKSGRYEIAFITRNPIAGYTPALAWYRCRVSWLRFCSPGVDAELDALHRAVEPAAKRAHTARLYHLLDDEVPSIALWQPATPYIMSAGLKAFRPSAYTTFDAITDARLNR